jgi:hypothetical protein
VRLGGLEDEPGVFAREPAERLVGKPSSTIIFSFTCA